MFELTKSLINNEKHQVFNLNNAFEFIVIIIGYLYNNDIMSQSDLDINLF